MSQDKLAVLIDADNTSHKHLEKILTEISSLGISHVKRAYGDWSKDSLRNWKDKLLENSVRPIQQYAYTQGKNSTDSAMIIDAMDLLYSRRYDAFCIVSSDSDFTRLVSRIREEGLKVYGFGREHSPSPFVKACDKFIFTEILSSDDDEEETCPNTPTPQRVIKDIATFKPLVLEAFKNALRNDEEWLNLGLLGTQLNSLDPSFDCRNYGFPKLSALVSELDYLEVERRQKEEHSNLSYYVKPKE